MSDEAGPPESVPELTEDIERLHALGYAQELARKLAGFSSFALSFSIICILAGGVTSFHLGLCSVGGASIGLGWPLMSLFALIVAATMAQLASTFPTAGGVYHWAAILGGRGWGWATAWFNLVGLITVLAAINVGTFRFASDAFFPHGLGLQLDPVTQALSVLLITSTQAMINHLGIKATARLTDLSGYWILLVTLVLTLCALVFAPSLDPTRLVIIQNFSGTPGGSVWPPMATLGLLFAQGLLLPAYTITGFDASAHAAEETLRAAQSVPRGITRSVLVSGVAGWILLSAMILAAPSVPEAAAKGEQAFLWILNQVLPWPLVLILAASIVLAQYLCGLATVTSASRIAFAFARDGGLPFSTHLRWVCPRWQSPPVAIWSVAVASVLFTLHTPVYTTITAVCTIFLYVSYVLPTALGAWAFGRTWTAIGPWNLGRWYRPLALISVAGCITLIMIAMQPPNQQSAWILGAALLLLAAGWFTVARHRFTGPPPISLRHKAQMN
jgi:amino acid transporter